MTTIHGLPEIRDNAARWRLVTALHRLFLESGGGRPKDHSGCTVEDCPWRQARLALEMVNAWPPESPDMLYLRLQVEHPPQI